MLFCQFSKSQSVGDISNGLRSARGTLNHLGIASAPSKSTVKLSKQTPRLDTVYRLLLSILKPVDIFGRVSSVQLQDYIQAIHAGLNDGQSISESF